VYTVDLTVTFDGATSAGQVLDLPWPKGHVLGTVNGRFRVFAVPRGSKPLTVDLPTHAFLTPPAAFSVTATTPKGMQLQSAFVTTTMPGFVLENRSSAASGRTFAYAYNPVALSAGFPNLDVVHFTGPVAADVVTVTLFGKGVNAQGQHGAELFTGLSAPP
jgi:hypothetical protein